MPNMRFRGRENTMHSILKRSAALIASAATLLGGGMLMAGTAQADGIGLPVMTIHPAASTSYPKELVNGDFQTFGNRIVDKRSGGWQYLSFVDGNGMAMEGSSERPWAKVDGWDAVKFGWKSNDSVSGHRGIVEVQRFRTAVKGSTGNVWGEIAAATQGKYLYQDIDTANTSDAMYTVRLKHASRNKDARDSMQVLVGAPGREKPVTMRRTIANAGDKAGEESTTITSTGTGQDDQWDTYEGTVLVPRGQDVTRFTFKSVADSNSAGRPDSAEGNLIDDVVFTKAYQLTYDANGGVKTRTSQIDYTTGGGTRGKVKTVRDSPAPPAGQEKIVNGDFEYSGTGAGLSDSPFNYVSLSRKSYYYKDSRNVNHRVALPAGFDAKRFAWKSDQTGKDLGNPPYEQAGDVQVWNRYDGSNHYAELTAAQAGSAIYQDIDTESDSDVQYIVSLRHASLNASHLDSMQVLIGAPGHETPVTMTRVTANGHGDKVGESSDTIATRVSNPKPADREDSDHTGQWETYTGTVTVPAGRPVTRFTFRNVSSKSAWNGNLIDDIAFTKARRLDYDANGGTKAQASQIGYRTDATQGAVETVASKTLPTELVNGSFDYLLDGGWDTISPVGRGGYADDRGWGRFTSVDTASGEYIQNAGQNPATFDSTGKWVKWPGFDAAKFGWASDQKGGQPQGGVGLTDRPNAVELQQDSVTGNTYAEIVGSERGKAILQKIDTQHDSDTVYTVRFDHASLSKEHADSMQVLVNGKPVTMTRVTSNKAGDEQGWTGTSITTHATNTNRFQHDGQWATYEGKVTIPANTPVSTFTFKALNAVDPTKGNLIDNLTFKIAYRLSYDSNGGTKAKASQISSMTEGKASETDGKVKTVADDAAGSVPSNENAGAVKQAKSKTNGSVRLAADDDVAEYAVNGLPDHLVNGDFEYPTADIMGKSDGRFWYISQNDNSWWANAKLTGKEKRSTLPAGFDKSKFAWHSTQTGNTHYPILERADDIQVDYKGDGTNHYSEIIAAQGGSTLYQDVATTPGVMYRWSLKHASINSANIDRMSVMIGEPGKETAQEATRTTVNGNGDKTGKVGTEIATKVSNSASDGWDHTGQWETYTGTYIATSTVTRFAFRSIEGGGKTQGEAWDGNLLDDVQFTKAYKLSYDKNASDATGKVPSNQRGKENTVQPAKARTDGTVKLVDDAATRSSNLPKQLVNSDFDHDWRNIVSQSKMTDKYNFANVDPAHGDVEISGALNDKGEASKQWVHLNGFDANKFGWKSNQTDTRVDGRGGIVEIQRSRANDNMYAEITASQANTYLYQDIDTAHSVPTVYTVKLRYAHRNGSIGSNEKIQVLVGAPGHEQPVTMTRIASRNNNRIGEKSTTVNAPNTDGWLGSWDTFQGSVEIPAGQPVSRFTFKALGSIDGVTGNLIDDVQFKLAYKLSYDKNAQDATGSVPSNQYGKENTVQPANSKTTGSVRLAADKTASGLTVHDLKKNDKGKVPSSSKADSTQPAAFKAPDAKVETIVSRAAGDELAVNGGFDTPKWTIAKEGQGLPWVYVKPNAGTIRSYAQAMAGQTGVKAGGLTAATFAWQDLDAIGSNQNFELHREKDGNTAADVHAGRTVAQTVNTTPSAAYTFSIRHSGRSKGNAGGVTLLTGPDKDHLTPVRLTRTTVSKTGAKYGDRTGDVGTVAYTHSDSMDATEGSHDPWDHSDDWESYEGTVIIPAGQSRTMIAYRGVAKDGTLTASANDSIIDDLSFRLAYKLTYDANGGKGSVPSHTEAGKVEAASAKTAGSVHAISDATDTTGSAEGKAVSGVLTDTTVDAGDGTRQRTITRSDGSVQVQTIADTGAVSGCQVYYPAGARITLATAKADSDCWDSSQISKTNRTFYGWSANTDANDKDVPVADTMDRATLDANAETQITMPARAKTVYALWAINPTLTYNVNAPATTKAPDAPASMTVPYNTAADDKSGWTVGDTGKITGYSFDGWYTSPTGGDKYDWSTKLTNDVTMYAHWTANGYTVKYDAGGGKGTMGDQKFTFDVPQNLSPNAFTRDGYTFTGWKRADTGDSYTDGQQVSNLTSTPNGIVTMIAQWTPNPASINYDPNPPTGRTPGGQGTANWTGHTGDTQAIGANGWTVDGYTFIGWNTSADGKGTAYAPGTTWTANGTLTLYAQWTPGQAGLTYDGNGATGGKTDPQPGKTDEKINVRDNGFTRDGYMFVTWNTQADCKGKAVDPGDEWTLQGSGTLYACWAGTAQTLAYHGNGATGGNTASQSGKTGDELTTNANGFTRDGYTFVRWDTAKDGSGTAYGEGKNGVSQYTMKPAGNDLYAIWKANPASIVYRNGYPNTTGSTPDTTGSTGDTVTVSQNGFDRPGYTFTGWSTSKRGDPSLNPGDKHTLEPGTTTVWAQWKANPAHLVYNSNIGSIGSETRTVDGVVDQTVKTIDNPFDRPGYTFSGWNTQADGKGKAYDPGADCTLTANDKSTPKNTSVLYAQWTINKVTLKFDPNGGVGGYPSINTDAFGSVTIPKDAKEPKVTRPGFRFTGWSLKKTPDKDETLLTPGKDTVSMPAEGEVAVYAQWEPAMTTLPFTGGNAQIPTIWLWAGLAFLIIAAGAFSPMIRLRMGAGSKGRHAGTPTIGRHSR